MDILTEARNVFDTEIDALLKTKEALDDTFIRIIRVISECTGKVIITGMGKPGHIAKKISATMSSLGTSSFYLHPAEALHGDLGMVSQDDVLIMISYSGESEEIIKLLPNIRVIGTKVVAITGNPNSTLAMYSDIVQVIPKFREACSLNLAPTSTTTATLVYGDALAVVTAMLSGFSEENYGLFHPSGSLGKKLLLRVSDIMAVGERNPFVNSGEYLKNAIIEMSKKTLGVVIVVDDEGGLAGIITDGDLRRLLEKGADVYQLRVEEIMTKTPQYTYAKCMAADALKLLVARRISSLPVLDESNAVVGTITLQNILNTGIVL